MCENPTFIQIMAYFKFIIKFVLIIAPLVLIVYVMYKLTEELVKKTSDPMTVIKTIFQKFSTTIFIYMLFSVISIILSFFGSNPQNAFINCINSATKEKYDYYVTIEKLNKLSQNTRDTLSKSVLKTYYNAIINSVGILSEEELLAYLIDYQNLEAQVADMSTKADCLSKAGSYINGKCVMPESVSPVNMSDYQNYYIINTKTSPLDYYNNYVRRYSIYQTKTQYADQCLGIAMIYAYGMYFQAYRVPTDDIKNTYSKGTNFRAYPSDSKQTVLRFIYNELAHNKPVILQVNGNRSGTSRHYVTVVGFDKSIKSVSDLTSEKQLFIMDPYPSQNAGGFTSLGNRGRFMIQGYACGSAPMYQYGFQAYYIK